MKNKFNPSGIPEEMKAHAQWVCVNEAKEPAHPQGGYKINAQDAANWLTFDEAVRFAEQRGWWVAFVFSDADPFVCVDLDNKDQDDRKTALHHSIVQEAGDTYAERSKSGTGFHIVVKGSMSSGTRKSPAHGIEIFPKGQYVIITGDAVRLAPIADGQALLDYLLARMPAPLSSVALEDREAVMEDEEVIELAMNAANADKFNELCRGDWQAMGYESQSEADMALLSILAYYSLDNEQVRRIFRMSNLGKREKATKNDKYLNYALGKIRAQTPLIDWAEAEAFTAQAIERAKAVAAPLPQAQPSAPAHSPAPRPEGATTSAFAWPPGLVGDIAQYIHGTAILPVPEVALVAALGLVAGVTGRQFNTYTGAGLNLYLTLIGETGIGKEEGKRGISRVLKRLLHKVPMFSRFIGPTSFASGQALMNRVGEQPCFYSVLGEFGHTLKRLTHPKASNADIALQKAFLDLYSYSGEDGVSGEGAYSDREKNTELVISPSFAIINESTPGVFYDCIDANLAASGFVSRFLIVEYTGDRPDRNKETAGWPPSDDLVDRLGALAASVINMEQGKTFYRIQPNAAAVELLDGFDAECTRLIRGGDEVQRQLWTRAHLNALKVSALLAAGSAAGTGYAPVVTADQAHWAIEFVRRSVRTVLARFEKGEVGGSDMSKAEVVIRKKIEIFLSMTPAQRAKKNMGIPIRMQEGPAVPYAFLCRQVRDVQPFKGNQRLLGDILAEMVKAEVLQKIPPQEALEKYGSKGDCYVIGPHFNN